MPSVSIQIRLGIYLRTNIAHSHVQLSIVSDVKVSGFLRLSVSMLGKLSVIEMDTLAAIDSVASRITGLMDSQEETDLYNELIEQLLPELLQTNRRQMSDTISALLMPVINEFLADVTLGDLIGAGDDGGSELLCTAV